MFIWYLYKAHIFLQIAIFFKFPYSVVLLVRDLSQLRNILGWACTAYTSEPLLQFLQISCLNIFVQLHIFSTANNILLVLHNSSFTNFILHLKRKIQTSYTLPKENITQNLLDYKNTTTDVLYKSMVRILLNALFNLPLYLPISLATVPGSNTLINGVTTYYINRRRSKCWNWWGTWTGLRYFKIIFWNIIWNKNVNTISFNYSNTLYAKDPTVHVRRFFSNRSSLISYILKKLLINNNQNRSK